MAEIRYLDEGDVFPCWDDCEAYPTAQELDRAEAIWLAEKAADFSGDRLLDGPDTDMFGQPMSVHDRY